MAPNQARLGETSDQGVREKGTAVTRKIKVPRQISCKTVMHSHVMVNFKLNILLPQVKAVRHVLDEEFEDLFGYGKLFNTKLHKTAYEVS